MSKQTVLLRKSDTNENNHYLAISAALACQTVLQFSSGWLTLNIEIFPNYLSYQVNNQDKYVQYLL